MNRDRAIPLLHDYLFDAAARLPDKVALVCGDHRVTYAELAARARALARALVARGVQRGDRVVVFADNTVETVVSFWGVLKANAIVSIVNPLTKVDKLAYLLNDCRARVLISDAHLAHVFADAAKRSPHLGAVIVSGTLDDRARAATASLPGLVSWSDALAEDRERAGAPLRRHRPRVDHLHVAARTGEPKGVMLTHRNMLTACDVDRARTSRSPRTRSSSACCRSRSTTASTR